MLISEFIKILKPEDFRIFNPRSASFMKLDSADASDLSTRVLNREINSIQIDSRKVAANDAFFAVKGHRTDGHKYIASAIAGRAILICVERGLFDFDEIAAAYAEKNGKAAADLPETATADFGTSDESQVQTFAIAVFQDSKAALSQASAAFYNYPQKSLRGIAVTGTKGKTCVSFYIAELLNYFGAKTAVIGTCGVYYPAETAVTGEIKMYKHCDTANTTPGPPEIFKILAELRAQNFEFFVSEFSSQAGQDRRCAGICFEKALFLNLYRDHIGPLEHKDFANYRDSKAALLDIAETALIRVDNAAGSAVFQELAAVKNTPCKCFSLDDYTYQGAERNSQPGIAFKYRGEEFFLASPGRFSLANAIAALAALEDFEEFDLKRAVEVFPFLKVPGRMHFIDYKGALCVIDYAHNQESLKAALEALLPFKKPRASIYVLIGTVGEKTFERRRELPQTAAKYCDFICLSSDNPEFEDPQKIIDEMLQNLPDDFPRERVLAEPDREKAVKMVLKRLKKDDIFLLAGKGHEKFQAIKGRKVPFDEEAVIQSALKNDKS